jgi:hypothetical protein
VTNVEARATEDFKAVLRRQSAPREEGES